MELSYHRSLPPELQIMPFQLRCMELIGLVGPKGRFYRFVLAFGWGTFVILLPKSVLGIGSSELDAIIKGFAELLFEGNLFIAVASLVPKLPLVKRLLHVLSEIFRQATHDKHDAKDQCYALICEQNSKIDKFCKFYFIYCCFGPFVFCIPAMVTSYVRYFGTTNNGTNANGSEHLWFELPMEQEFYWLPIRTNFACYHLFLALSLSANCVCSYMSVIKVSTLLIMIKYCSLVYRLVAIRIRDLGKLPPGRKQDETDEDERTKMVMVKEVVEMHEKALEATDLVEKVINIPIAMQFMACILFWCMTMVYVSTNINFNLFNVMVLFWLSLIETYGYSYLGTELNEDAKAVGHAVYDLPWYEDSAQLQRYYRLMIQRSQQNTGVTAAKFFIVGIEKFGKVVNLSYSYYLVLKDVLDRL
uniref:Odorant receptor n=1 Tax=Aedes aegypti TaxID=7159 RepID=A0A3Q8HEI8_AEDAE|nr:odorant receptor 71 [Aedes aegypti]